jgi:hypothetical protein
MTVCFFQLNIWASTPMVDGLVYIEIVDAGTFCSGSIFAPHGYDKNQKALVITNGHCTGMGSLSVYGGTYLSTTERLNFVEAPNTYLVLFKKNAAEGEVDINANNTARLLVATMYKKDLAIYEIEYSYAQLEEFGYFPLILGSKVPELKSQVVYHSSAWGSQVSCQLEAYADMVIEGFWVWNNVMRLTGDNCHAQGGASGSPVLDAEGKLVALMNTMYEGGQKCTVMNPCERERDSGNASVHNGAVYAIPVVDLNACFVSSKKLDLKRCNLQ